MQFLHITLLPSVIFILSIVLQFWFNKDEFFEFYKLYFLGIAAGIVFLIVSSFFNGIFAYSANHTTVFLRSLIIDGFLFTGIFCTAIYFIFDLLVKHSMTSTWSLTSILCFSYVSGLYTSINISGALNNVYPTNILLYISLFALMIFISLILGIGLPNFMDAYDLFKKILWGIFTIGIIMIVLTAYNYLLFYNYSYHYLIILVTGVFLVFFEVHDFKLFRG
jgi:hypothetical protein